jgi:phage virion morphogenesis protein
MSAHDFTSQLEAWLLPLLEQLQPPQIRSLARRLALELRRSQSKRIAAQRNVDGTAYVPRRQRKLRHGEGGVQRSERERVKAMFEKLRTGSHLKIRSNDSVASVEVQGRSARIARVHQFGLADRAQPHGPIVQYAAREILGFTDQDVKLIAETIQRALS